jgi:hypothetical protein
VEAKVHHEEALAIESESLPSTSQDLTPKSSPDLETPKEEEIQPSVFLFSFEEDIFEDYGKTSNYLYTKRPLVPITPFDPNEDKFLKETNKELTSISSNEWLREVELTPECQIQGTTMNALYNPTVGANIMSDFVALTFLGNESLASTSKIFKSSSGSRVEGYEIL